MADLEQADDYSFEPLYDLEFSSGPPKISRYENNAPIRELMEEYVIEESGKDVNEYLREAQQVIENYLMDIEGRE